MERKKSKIFKNIFSNLSVFDKFDCYTSAEMRTRIVEFLSQVKSATRIELATRFEVSVETINRDIMYISKIAPIYTKQENGGVYILPEYKSYKNYLTEAEENLLCCMIEKVSKEERSLLTGKLQWSMEYRNR